MAAPGQGPAPFDVLDASLDAETLPIDSAQRAQRAGQGAALGNDSSSRRVSFLAPPSRDTHPESNGSRLRRDESALISDKAILADEMAEWAPADLGPYSAAELHKLQLYRESIEFKDTHVRVGVKFQASLPTYRPFGVPLPNGAAREPEPERDELLWRPNHELMPPAALDSYLDAARVFALAGGEELALSVLMRHEYSRERALLELSARACAELGDRPNAWSGTEVALFNVLLAARGQDFAAIARGLRTRTSFECVAHYYSAHKVELPTGYDSDFECCASGSVSEDETAEPRASLHPALAFLRPEANEHSLIRMRAAEPTEPVEVDALMGDEHTVRFFASPSEWTRASRTFCDSPVLESLTLKRKRAALEMSDDGAGAGGAPRDPDAALAHCVLSPPALFAEMADALGVPAAKRPRPLPVDGGADDDGDDDPSPAECVVM